MNEFLFVEKYRPKTIEECVLPSDLKAKFQQFVDDGAIPNLLLSGTAGVGKTTVARAMLETIGCDYIVINGSMNGNIDTLRTEIKDFASTVSMMGGRKYVILDESDHLNCIADHERIKLADGTTVALKDLAPNDIYEVVSFNTETKKFEPDTAQVVKYAKKQTYEVELEDGRTLQVTDDHPFMVVDSDGNVQERTIKQGFDGYEVISF